MLRIALVSGLLALGLAPVASADVLLPPRGKVYTGLSGERTAGSFTAQVGKRPSVFGFFTQWGAISEFIYESADRAGARPMLHISTQDGYGTRERITPRGIARGGGDGYLARLNRRLADYAKPVYVRLMAEMNQTNNGYCAYNANGSSRGPSHSTRAFRQAWRRSTLVLRGGPVDAINARLRKLGLPALKIADTTLPRPQLSMLWVPQTEGTPNTHANRARAYWPGAGYVDWVGTDFYSRFPNFRALDAFYADFPRKPFAFGEWAMWGRDDPAFVRRFFSWINSHKRVRMVLYNRGNSPASPLKLSRYPASRAAIKKALEAKRYLGRP
jgi:hypothetical protein